MNQTETLLISLLRAYLGNGPLPDRMDLSEGDWEELYQFASLQGVSTLIFGMVSKFEMPFPVKIKWAVKAQECQKRFHKQLEVIKETSDLVKEASGTPVLLKGAGIARLYPVPEERECGDIDYYTGECFDKFNEALAGSGHPVLKKDEKHSSFEYDGVIIENHQKLNYSSLNKSNFIAGKAIVEEMDKGRRCVGDLPCVLLPSPTANALYLMMHMLGHLSWGGVPLRNILDWAFFLEKEGKEVDWERVQSVWRESELYGAAAIINRICTDLLGCGGEYAGPKMESDDKEYSFVVNDILHPCKDPRQTGNLLRKFIIKTERYNRRKRRHYIIYRSPFPDSFFKEYFLPKEED